MKDPSTIEAAMDLLLEAIESELKEMNRSGAEALSASNYQAATELLTKAKSLDDVRQKLIAIEDDISKLIAGSKAKANSKGAPQRFRRPIPVLETLTHAEFVALRKRGMTNDEIVRLHGKSIESVR